MSSTVWESLFEEVTTSETRNSNVLVWAHWLQDLHFYVLPIRLKDRKKGE
jgi:hypothetical protein